MKMLLLIPLMIVASVSGYNLYIDATGLVFYQALHLTVLIICLSAIALLIRSMFTIQTIAIGEEEVQPAVAPVDDELVLQHQ